jgi:tetratricopeptide (TPR) repeat protein
MLTPCPHCRNPVELDQCTPGQKIVCPSCGSSFHPDQEPTRPFEGSRTDEEAAGLATAVVRQRRGSFTIVRPHARGGLGQVSLARDDKLGRQVALKEIRPDRPDSHTVRQRFLTEAEITGQLEHPGIVPIYALDQDEQGKPYYVMRFVQGRTLADAIAAYHAQPNPLAFNDLLTRFASVCQTVAYAHSKGVIHRDLKPANVMLGEYGETLVVDWGLAKRMRPYSPTPLAKLEREAGEDEPDSPVVDPGLTTAGQVLGTPSYMSPEQARGEPERLDERCDVFGLGGILCAILTGQAVYLGDSEAEVLENARKGDIAGALARLDACGADRTLVQLAKSCLAVEAADRPTNAGAVAGAVTAHLASAQERLRQAEIERAAAQAKAAEARKRQRLTLALAASLLLTALLGGGGWLWLERWRNEQKRENALAAARAADEALATAVQFRAEARAATKFDLVRWNAARSEAKRAQDLLGSRDANEPLWQHLEHFLADLETEQQDRWMLNELVDIRLTRIDVEDDAFTQKEQVYAYVAAFRKYGIDVENLPPQEAAARLRSRAIHAELVAAVDRWMVILRATRVTVPEKERRWRALLDVARAADPDPRRDQLRQAIRDKDLNVLKALAASPETMDWPALTLVRLGAVLVIWGNPADAVAILRKAQERQPDDIWINHQLALALANVDPPQYDEAIRYFMKSLSLNSQHAGVWFNLAWTLGKKGSWDEAIGAYEQAIRLKRDYFQAYYQVGTAHAKRGRLDEALAAYHEAIRIKPDQAETHVNLGIVLREKGLLDEAATSCRKAIRLKPELALAHHHLGFALRVRGDLDGAVAALKQAILLDPSHAEAHYQLGLVFRAKQLMDDALVAFQEAARLKPDHVHAHGEIGIILCDVRRDYEGAIAAFQTALRLRPDSAVMHTNLGKALLGKGLIDEAVASYRLAAHFGPEYAEAHAGLGRALAAKRLWLEAIPAYQRALELKPDYGAAQTGLGVALQLKGDLRGSLAAYREAVRLRPDDPRAHYNLGNALRHSGDHDGAVAAYEKAIAIRPDHAEAHCNLGHAFQEQGDFVNALAALKRGHQLSTQRGKEWRYPSEQWISTCQRLLDLEPKLALLLAGEEPSGDDADKLDYARLCYYKRRYGLSARFYQEAFAADPARADDVKAGRRYDAACAAARAGTGSTRDDPPLDNEARARWRAQALHWLQSELSAWTKMLQSGTDEDQRVALSRLNHSRSDRDLAGLREPVELAKVPEEEQQTWRQFWAKVATLQKNTSRQ